MLKRPLRQIHDIGRFVNSHCPVGRTSCNHQTQMFRSELDISNGCSGVDQGSPFRPMKIGFIFVAINWNGNGNGIRRKWSLFTSGFQISWHFFPDGGCSIKRAGGKNLSEFWVGPRAFPYGSRVRFPGCRTMPGVLITVPDPNAYGLITGTGGQMGPIPIESHIVN